MDNLPRLARDKKTIPDEAIPDRHTHTWVIHDRSAVVPSAEGNTQRTCTVKKQAKWKDRTANCSIIVQNVHFSLLFSGAILQITPAQSDFQ
jgi:hypothetical protein